MSLVIGQAIKKEVVTMESVIIRACNDRRYKAEHFIISEVTAEYLRRHRIDMRLGDFKKLVRGTSPAFVTHTGNAKKAPLMAVNVYSITDIKKLIEGGQDYVQCQLL